MKLGAKTREVLQAMADHKDEDEGTLVHSTPGGWWLGDNRVAGRIGYHLLRLCLIREQSFCSENCRYYDLNEEGREVLKNPDYVPKIIPHLIGTQ